MALDNVEARKHVNKMCIYANVAIFDSGTNGLNGQNQFYLPKISKCYSCTEKVKPKTY